MPPLDGARDTLRVIAFVTAGTGFLLAVLWFDLMFDVQAIGHPRSELPGDVLASISGYYGRVTTAARPMNRLIASVMLATLACIVAEIFDADTPSWVAWASLILAAGAVLTAGLRTVPSAVRLGARRDGSDRQSALARSILRQHLACFAAIVAVLALQLAST
jgi:hypothetical protein